MDQTEADVSERFHALRSNLLRGDLSGLDAHLSMLAALGEEVAKGQHSREALSKIRAEAERSREVLAAAAGGVRAALRKLGEAGAATSVYAPDGKRMPLSSAPSRRGSRA